MSDARLREIRKGIEFNQMGMDEDEALFAISDLLAEVERLRAREAALAAAEAERAQWRGVVEIMAKGPLSWSPEFGDICACCDAAWIDGDPDDDQPGAIQHTSDCAVVQARALLASDAEAEAAQGEGLCELCGGSGRYIRAIAYEDTDGTVREGMSNILCHGCNGTGKRKPPRRHRPAAQGEA